MAPRKPSHSQGEGEIGQKQDGTPLGQTPKAAAPQDSASQCRVSVFVFVLFFYFVFSHYEQMPDRSSLREGRFIAACFKGCLWSRGDAMVADVAGPTMEETQLLCSSALKHLG